MARIVILKNTTGVDKTYAGQTILAGGQYDVPSDEYGNFSKDSSLFDDVSFGDIVVNDGTNDLNSLNGWNHLIGDIPVTVNIAEAQTNQSLGGKVAVHSSAKPVLPGEPDTYVVWSGAGDDMGNPTIVGGGEPLNFQMTIGTPEVVKDVEWNHAEFGRIWIHEAYMKFTDGGVGDYLSAYVMSYPTPLQTLANLDLVLEPNPDVPGENFVKYSTEGPGSGTHGFGGTPNLIPRTFTLDGDWDFDGVNLTPNFAGTGQYRISDTEHPVHKYFNKLPCSGSCTTYFTMSSDETAEVRPGYFVRVKCKNISNSNWEVSIIMEMYRQRTAF